MEAQPQKKLDPNRIVNPDTGVFDTIVEHIDPKSKRVIGVNPYRMYCVGKDLVVFERPVGSGHLWYKSGEPAGQLDYDVLEEARKKKAKDALEQAVKIGAEHKPWNPPATGDELLMREANKQKEELDALKAELAAIKAEKEKPAQAAKPKAN